MNKLLQYVGAGTEQLGGERRNFVNIAQKLSGVIDSDHPDYIEGVKAGDIYCTALKKHYGQSIEVVVLGTQTVYMFTDIQGQYKGMKTRWDNSWSKGADGRFHTTEGYTVASSIRFYCVTPEDLNTPLVIAFKGSASQTAKQFQTLLKELTIEGQPAPIFAGIWKFTTTKQQNDKGSWYSFALPECIGFIEDEMVDTIAGQFNKTKLAIETSLTQSQAQQVTALIEDDTTEVQF